METCIYIACGWIVGTWLFAGLIYASHKVSYPERDKLDDRLIQARLYNFNRRTRL